MSTSWHGFCTYFRMRSIVHFRVGDSEMRAVLKFSVFTFISLLWGLSAAMAGPIGIGAFGSGAISTDFDNIGGDGPRPSPLDVDGHIFTSSDGNFRYFPCSIANRCLTTDSDAGTIEIELVGLSLRSGAEVVGFAGSSSAGAARFYDQANTLLGTVSFTITGPGRQFVGWEESDTIISRISLGFTSTNGHVEGVDNLIYETGTTVPVPGALALLGFGLIGLGMRRRSA